jgi:hypothetical protein
MSSLAIFGWLGTIVCIAVIVQSFTQFRDADDMLRDKKPGISMPRDQYHALSANKRFALRKIGVCTVLGLVSLGVAVYCTFFKVEFGVDASMYDRRRRRH